MNDYQKELLGWEDICEGDCKYEYMFSLLHPHTHNKKPSSMEKNKKCDNCGDGDMAFIGETMGICFLLDTIVLLSRYQCKKCQCFREVSSEPPISFLEASFKERY